MRKIIITENHIRSIIDRLITEKLGVPDNITQVAEQIYDQICDEFSRDNESYEYGEAPDSNQIRGDYKIGDYEFDEIIVSIIPHKNYSSPSIPILVSFGLALNTEIQDYKIVHKEELGKIRINLVIATGDKWMVSEVATALLKERNKFVSVFSHELHHAYVGYKKPSTTASRQTEYQSIQALHFNSITPIYNFLFYLYYIDAIEDIVRPSEVYSTMRIQNITKSQFKEFFQNNDVIIILKAIRNFKVDTMIGELYSYIPQIDDFFDQVETDKKLPFKLPQRGNTEESKIHAFLDVIYQLIIYSKIGAYGDFLQRTVRITNPMALLFGKKYMSDDEINSIDKADKEMQKYSNKLGKVKNYQEFFGNEEKRINFVADKTIKKLSKLYDMAKDNTSSSIVDWDLHHKINNTAEKTIQEVKKLFREGKLKISPPTESDLKNIKNKKIKL